jgi:uncharacterized protein (TIGR02996 family)
MSDEEGLLRGVIASPGDAAPRLVYADWLEERDDLRGAYLRAEVAWARKRTKTGAKKLQKMAEGLDPVWAARVTRPPAGVCCDRVNFTKPGPQLAPPDLDRVETEMGMRFPPQFRAFYLNWNGGRPSPAHVPDPRPRWADMPLFISHFITAGKLAKELRFSHSLGQYLREPSNDVPLIRDMVQFADTPDDLGHFFIGVGKRNFGRVFHFTDFCHSLEEPEQLREMAPSFGEVLNKIGPKSRK